MRTNVKPVIVNDWFITAIPASTKSSGRGPVRIWGYTNDNAPNGTIWRSSSITERRSSTLLETRFGNLVQLQGPLNEACAQKVNMIADAMSSFRDGFPENWRDIASKAFSKELEQRRNAHVRKALCFDQDQSAVENDLSQGNGKNGDGDENKRIAKAVNLKSRKRPRSKKPPAPSIHTVDKGNVNFESDALASSLPKRHPRGHAPSTSRKLRSSKSRPLSALQLELHGGSQKDAPWSKKQKRAYAEMRNTISADNPNYWKLVAQGVEGKSEEACKRLWESSWISPQVPQNKTKASSAFRRPPRQRGVAFSTPEIAAAVSRNAPTNKQRQTAKYRAQMRHLAAAAARDADDKELEPPLPDIAETSTLPTPQVTPLITASKLKDGTPGSWVRAKKKSLEESAYIETPEILVRGRSFGLQEGDNYVALFKRRASRAQGKPATDDQAPKSKLPAKGDLKYRSERGAPNFVTSDDNSSSASETVDDDSDLFF